MQRILSDREICLNVLHPYFYSIVFVYQTRECTFAKRISAAFVQGFTLVMSWVPHSHFYFVKTFGGIIFFQKLLCECCSKVTTKVFSFLQYLAICKLSQFFTIRNILKLLVIFLGVLQIYMGRA